MTFLSRPSKTSALSILKRGLVIVSLILVPLMTMAEVVFVEHTDEVSRVAPAHLMGTTEAAWRFLRDARRQTFLLGDSCSGVFVSSTGHFVTALHCVDLLEKSVGELFSIRNLADVGTEKLPSYISLRVADRSMEGRNLARPVISANANLSESDDLPLKVVKLGRSWPLFNSFWSDALLRRPDLVERIKTQSEDYAVLKLNRMPPGYSCAKTSDALVSENEIVWVTGFPVQTRSDSYFPSRADLDELSSAAAESSVRDELISVIERLSSLLRRTRNEDWSRRERMESQHPLYIAIGRAYRSLRRASAALTHPVKEVAFVDAIADDGRTIVSTAVTKSGFSGGGLFNSRGELIGINFMKPAAATYGLQGFSPYTIHFRIDAVKSEIRKALGDTALAEIFNCP